MSPAPRTSGRVFSPADVKIAPQTSGRYTPPPASDPVGAYFVFGTLAILLVGALGVFVYSTIGPELAARLAGLSLVLVAILAGWAVMAGLAAYVARAKGRPLAEGVILGLLFGPFGVLVVALLPTVARSGK